MKELKMPMEKKEKRVYNGFDPLFYDAPMPVISVLAGKIKRT